MLREPMVFAVSLLTVATVHASAQAAARQGVAPPPEIQHFESPMILDLALPDVGALEPRTQMKLPSVRKYVCDNDVTLMNLAVAKRYKGPKRSRSLDLVVSGLVFVEDSYDRRVDLALRLKSSERIMASGRLDNYSAEEGRTTKFQLFLPVDESELLSALAADPAPTLELTLTVRDDS